MDGRSFSLFAHAYDRDMRYLFPHILFYLCVFFLCVLLHLLTCVDNNKTRICSHIWYRQRYVVMCGC